MYWLLRVVAAQLLIGFESFLGMGQHTIKKELGNEGLGSEELRDVSRHKTMPG